MAPPAGGLSQQAAVRSGIPASPRTHMGPAGRGPGGVGPSAQDGRFAMDRDDSGIELIGQDAKMVAIGELIRRTARSTVPVLISGEPGTGKALIARAIHRGSYRADKSFVAVHCGASPEPVLARELFGYEPQASPGLGRWIGAFERARGGTLFLKEIGSLPPALQTT